MSSVGSSWSSADSPRPARRVPRMVDPMKASSTAIRLPFRRGSVEYSLGTEADHEAVYQTLLHVFHGPDREAFLGALSDPAYRPEQRLLAKVDGRIVSHGHLTEREIRYGLCDVANQRCDVGGNAARISRSGLRAEPDAAGRRAGPGNRITSFRH